MHVFNLQHEQSFSLNEHVEKILGTVGGGDFAIACWEPGQISPYHCHPSATEIYFCFEGGGIMNIPNGSVEVVPGSFVVHPPGELHEYVNGSARTLLFRVRYGRDMVSRHICWRGNNDWRQRTEDADYFAQHLSEDEIASIMAEPSPIGSARQLADAGFK
jgi:quercetin dioxygenase-like cupin family protein